MSQDGLFQLGMGAVLLKASQTEDMIARRVCRMTARTAARIRGLQDADGVWTASAACARRSTFTYM